jgi:hypothetical protein
MLRMVYERGRFLPRIFCDQCGEPIKDAAQGQYAWRVDDDAARAGEMVFLHKQCTPAFAEAHSVPWITEELAYLPVQLGADLALDWRKVREWLGSLI